MTAHDAAEWKRFLGDVCAGQAVSVDCETTGLVPARERIVGVSVGVPGRAMYCPVAHEGEGAASNVAGGLDILGVVLADRRVNKTFHNAAFDIAFLEHETGRRVRNYDDTLSHAACADERRLRWPKKGAHGALSLDALGEEFGFGGKGEAQDNLMAWCREHGPELLGITDPHKAAGFRRAGGTWKFAIRYAPIDLVAPYACMDADLPLRIKQALGSTPVYSTCERPVLRSVVSMNTAPKYLDLTHLCTLRDRYTREIAEVVGRNEDINLGSPLQVAARLYDEAGLQPHHRTPKSTSFPKGRPSVDRLGLLFVQKQHPLAGDVLLYRGRSKALGTYVDAWERIADAQGRIWPVFLNWATQTGRFSSRNPNFQNIPRDPAIRAAVVPPEGYGILMADYAQIEPRVLAHYTRDRHLVDIFNSGTDLYGTVARLIFRQCRDTDANDIKARFPLERQVAKTAILAVFYGAQGRKLRDILLLQADVNVPVNACKKIVSRIWAAFPGVNRFVRGLTHRASVDGEIRNMYGRVRHVGGVGGCKPRDATNTLIQGTSADIMKKALVAVERAGIPGRTVLQVHDELWMYVRKEDYSDDVRDAVCRAMNTCVDLRVPLKAEPSWVTTNWGDK